METRSHSLLGTFRRSDWFWSTTGAGTQQRRGATDSRGEYSSRHRREDNTGRHEYCLAAPNLAPAERFDLIIATNILVYYDNFEQSLALANVERMLRPGGFLLSNNALLELPFSRIHSLDYLTVVYSDRPDDGDHIVWYQRAAD